MSAPDPGRIDIRLEVRDGRIGGVDILSRRPAQIGRWFRGRPVAALASEVGMLFGLCGRSHAAAAELAVVATEGGEPSAERVQALVLGLVAERLFEHLRPIATGHLPATLDRLLKPAQTAQFATVAALAARLRAIPDARALAEEILGVIGQSSAFAYMADAASDIAGPEDRLAPADDAEVMVALADVTGFAMAPRLGARRPETGPAARRTTPNRMAARLIEIIEAAEILSGRREADPAQWLAVHNVAPGIGCGVVESPRGRLYYRVERAADGSIGWLDSLAPTEWNFAAGGPLARLLVGRVIGSLEEAGALGCKAAGLVDPCVEFAVEAVHA